jgi:hypothetical protein
MKTCERCGKEKLIAIVFNTDTLTLAEYFTMLEWNKMNGDKYCFDCVKELMVVKNVKIKNEKR